MGQVAPEVLRELEVEAYSSVMRALYAGTYDLVRSPSAARASATARRGVVVASASLASQCGWLEGDVCLRAPPCAPGRLLRFGAEARPPRSRGLASPAMGSGGSPALTAPRTPPSPFLLRFPPPFPAAAQEKEELLTKLRAHLHVDHSTHSVRLPRLARRGHLRGRPRHPGCRPADGGLRLPTRFFPPLRAQEVLASVKEDLQALKEGRELPSRARRSAQVRNATMQSEGCVDARLERGEGQGGGETEATEGAEGKEGAPESVWEVAGDRFGWSETSCNA